MTHRAHAAAALLLTFTVVVGCSSDSDDSPTSAASADTRVTVSPSASDTPEEPVQTLQAPDGDEAVQAAQTVFQAYDDNDADTACSLQTQRYTEDQIRQAIEDGYLESGASCAAMVAASNAFLKAFNVKLADAQFSLTSKTDDQAVVAVDYADGDDSVVTLVLDGDTWLVDADE